MPDERLEPAEAELQQWIDGLLEAPASTPSAPPALRANIATSFRRKRRRSLALKFTAAAATIAGVFFALPAPPVSVDRKVVSTPNTTIPNTTNPSTIAPPNTQPSVPTTNPVPTATFVGRSDLIVVPLESNDPTVTIVQVYPTTITHRRWQREAALQAALQSISPPQTPETPVRGG